MSKINSIQLNRLRKENIIEVLQTGGFNESRTLWIVVNSSFHPFIKYVRTECCEVVSRSQWIYIFN